MIKTNWNLVNEFSDDNDGYYIEYCKFSPNGNKIVSISNNTNSSKINIWSTKSGKLIQDIIDNTDNITNLQFSPVKDEDVFVTTGYSSNQWIKRWDATIDSDDTKCGMIMSEQHKSSVTTIEISPDGHLKQ